MCELTANLSGSDEWEHSKAEPSRSDQQIHVNKGNEMTIYAILTARNCNTNWPVSISCKSDLGAVVRPDDAKAKEVLIEVRP